MLLKQPSPIVKRILLLLCVFMLVVSSVPQSVEATRRVYSAVVYDTRTNLYSGHLIMDDSYLLSGHPEHAKFLAPSGMGAHFDTSVLPSIAQGRSLQSIVNEHSLTFPSQATFLPGSRQDMSRKDYFGAQAVTTILVPSLNAAILQVNESHVSNLQELRELRDVVLAAAAGERTSYKNSTFQVGRHTNNVYLDFEFDDPETNRVFRPANSDYLTITTTGENGRTTTTAYLHQIPKITSYEGDAAIDNKIPWWVVATHASSLFGSSPSLTAANIGEDLVKPGIFSAVVGRAMYELVTGVESALGLVPIPDMIFNQGARGTDMFVYGIFPSSWMPAVAIMFIVFQVVAWGLILFGIINLVFRKNLSTLSSAMRVDVMVSIQRMVFAGLILAFLFPFLGIMFNLNFMLTEVFSSFVDAGTRQRFFASMPQAGGGIAMVFAYFAYLIAALNINVSYLIRGLTVALLVGISPLFVAMMTLSESNRSVPITFIKNLAAHVFLQSIHAVVLGFLMLVPMAGMSGIESLVYIFALIPISEAIRSVVFGQAVSSIGNTANMLKGFTVAGYMVGRRAVASGYGKVTEEGRFKKQLAKKDKWTNDYQNSPHGQTQQMEAMKVRDKNTNAYRNSEDGQNYAVEKSLQNKRTTNMANDSREGMTFKLQEDAIVERNRSLIQDKDGNHSPTMKHTGHDGSGKYMTSQGPKSSEYKFNPTKAKQEKVEGWRHNGWRNETQKAAGDEGRSKRNNGISTAEKAKNSKYNS